MVRDEATSYCRLPPSSPPLALARLGLPLDGKCPGGLSRLPVAGAAAGGTERRAHHEQALNKNDIAVARNVRRGMAGDGGSAASV